MTLSPVEIDLIAKLQAQLSATAVADVRMEQYYRGTKRIEQLGMAIPPNMRRFTVAVNWPRVVVDTIERRQQVRALLLPGEEAADPRLRAIMDASNMRAQLKMFNRDRMIYGRAFLSVGTNEHHPELPLIRVESPREMSALVDVRREVVTAAARFYGVNELGMGPTNVTLYLPDSTVWVQKAQDGRWYEIDRDEHRLAAVPVIVHLNRRASGGWVGESEMTDVLDLTDSAMRTLTNLQFSIEAHGIPRIGASGVEKSDMVDKDGTPIPKWEAYFNSVWMLKNPAAKIFSLSASDVKNFETALRMYGTQAATVSGLPARYFGITSTNPGSADAIRADEVELVRTVESANDEVGVTLGWVGALALRFATGEWVEGNRVAVDWHDPSTPTVAQREDALAKRRQVGVISREGYWDELGWSEARKDRERAYFAAEAAEGLTGLKLGDDVGNAALG